jgi:DMSO/TMAO reductase YedYZ molybdopterin-dependent catalytic subunit
MGEKKSDTRSGRRDFLRLAGLGATAGAVAVASGASAQDAQASEAGEPETGAGYRETAHVKQYYKLAAF